MTLWRRLGDDTITFVKNYNTAYLSDQLNNFHKIIQFSFEVEHNGKLPFLDVLLIGSTNNIDTTVYRKPTNTDIYLNQNLHAPDTWQRGTLINQLNREVKLKYTENMNIECLTINQTALNEQEKPHLLLPVYATTFCKIYLEFTRFHFKS